MDDNAELFGGHRYKERNRFGKQSKSKVVAPLLRTVAFRGPEKIYPALWGLVSKQGFGGILQGKMTNICCLVIERHE